MIYFVTNNKISELYPSDIEYCDVTKVKEYFKDKKEIAIDTETTGFDPHTCEIITLQLGDHGTQFVIDAKTIDLLLFKDLLEGHKLILQNAKFDLRFLYKLGIWPTNVYDTFLAEVKLNLGIPNVRKNLQVLAEKYCNTKEVDKSLRGLIHSEGLSSVVVKYAANDVKYLHKIKEKQEKLAEIQGLTKDIDKENKFVPALAYTEYCGMYIDSEKWTKKYLRSKEMLDKSKKTLNQYIKDNNLSKYIDKQLDLFSTGRKVLINWNSDKQVKPLFKDLGVNITIKVKGVEKESVEAPVLVKQKKDFPIIPLYLDYKKWEKDCSTYGLSFLNHVNKNTGRIHTNFTQCVDTGRMASGGTNKATKEKYINFQNIPRTPEKENRIEGMIYARECITSQINDNTLVNADYSGQENVVLTNKSQDPDLIQFYKDDLGDFHSFVASKVYPELRDLSLSDIKKHHKGKRYMAKTAGFALAYGGTGWTVANNLGISEQEGNKLEQAYFEAFPGLKQYFDNCEKRTLRQGYILIDDLLGTKFYISGFGKFQELKHNFTKLSKEEKAYYYRWKGVLRRNSLNYPVQGCSANITKIAVIYFYKWILQNNYQNIVKIINQIHDEISCECPKDIAQQVANKLQECMEKAGDIYCKIVPLKAEPEITEYWSH